MENISQKTSPPRGRPRKAPDYMWDLATRMEGRHLAPAPGQLPLWGAPSVLGDDPRFAWLKQPHRGTIGDELGRLDDDEDLRTMALYLCEHRPTTRGGGDYPGLSPGDPPGSDHPRALSGPATGPGSLPHHARRHAPVRRRAGPRRRGAQADHARASPEADPTGAARGIPRPAVEGLRLSPARVGSRHSSCAWSCEALSSPACYVYYTLQRSTPCH